ncbi:acetate non-utilizing protein 9 [Uncinocarpus reesii 1704]|uniref:Succinate dehydrogenase assembly factor 3 n=1 Tax=Uncinocarpus reesii (strain UAMH 1704) TaxID=336963 RepID=C4JFG8_UNCRE|nr:acetate non-utilizing protein 9 [Uncinocarpus reesii 1704]EEP76133.1 acetate non-utilizing protein 9 [Uncinocarpus reesii 1704]
MRFSPLLRMASSSTITSPSSLRPAPLALLPPLPLYRRLLRAHRKLPRELRLLGDEYIKAEFRAHRDVENPIHIVGFLTEWQLYAQKLEGDSWRDEKLDKAKLEKMSDQQIAQLYELMQATKEKGDKDNGDS